MVVSVTEDVYRFASILSMCNAREFFSGKRQRAIQIIFDRASFPATPTSLTMVVVRMLLKALLLLCVVIRFDGRRLFVGAQDGDILTTTACNVRQDAYHARLDMYYFYLIEYNTDDADLVNLDGIESAIAHALASALSSCDDQHQPLFAVQFSAAGHAFSQGGT